jgi:CMP-N-acetylneuraminic acid synthetase
VNLYNDLKILAVIPARGGSKGVPRKNLKKISGKSLLQWAIERSNKSKFIDRLIISSEDIEIIEESKKFGCEVPFKRPDYLARDESSTNDVILHALENINGYDIVLCLQVTSPLVETEDIDLAIKACVDSDSKACISASIPEKSPYWMFKLNNKMVDPIFGESYFNKRRQDLPEVFIPNGAVYVAYSDWFKNNKSFYSKETTVHIMSREKSFDLDTELDFLLVETYLKQKSNNNS